MKLFKTFFLLQFLILLCVQCSVEKRIYTKGWNVQWHSNKRNVVENDRKENPSNETEIKSLSETIIENHSESAIEISENDALETSSILSENESQKEETIAPIKKEEKNLVFEGNVFSVKKIIPKPKEGENISPGMIFWIFCILISSYFIVSGFLILAAAGGLEGLALAVLGGFIFLISVLGLLISADMNHDRKSERTIKKEEIKPKKLKSPEEKKKEDRRFLIFFLSIAIVFIVPYVYLIHK